MPCDYSKYPPNWFTEIRPAVLKRANNCCEECGVHNHEILRKKDRKSIGSKEMDIIWSAVKIGGWSYEGALKLHGFVKIILTIAHLDNDKENWAVKLERLKALCQRCHLRLDAGHHAENRKNGRNWRENQFKLEI